MYVPQHLHLVSILTSDIFTFAMKFCIVICLLCVTTLLHGRMMSVAFLRKNKTIGMQRTQLRN